MRCVGTAPGVFLSNEWGAIPHAGLSPAETRSDWARRAKGGGNSGLTGRAGETQPFEVSLRGNVPAAATAAESDRVRTSPGVVPTRGSETSRLQREANGSAPLATGHFGASCGPPSPWVLIEIVTPLCGPTRRVPAPRRPPTLEAAQPPLRLSRLSTPRPACDPAVCPPSTCAVSSLMDESYQLSQRYYTALLLSNTLRQPDTSHPHRPGCQISSLRLAWGPSKWPRPYSDPLRETSQISSEMRMEY